MTRKLWIAAVALGLGGWLPGVDGQEASWRCVSRPDAPTPAVQMGKPVPITRCSSAVLGEAPLPFPPAYRPGREVADSGVQAIATVPAPGAVIAASVPAPQTIHSLPPAPPV